jgi:hypothetical protein
MSHPYTGRGKKQPSFEERAGAGTPERERPWYALDDFCRAQEARLRRTLLPARDHHHTRTPEEQAAVRLTRLRNGEARQLTRRDLLAFGHEESRGNVHHYRGVKRHASD